VASEAIGDGLDEHRLPLVAGAPDRLAEHPVRVDDVHPGSAAAPRDAVLAPEQLRHHVARVAPAGERVAVRAVGRDEVVLVAHRTHGSDDRGLLADREVQEAADLRLGVHLARALLEAPDQRHRLQPLPRGAGVGEVFH